jgi:hypothetical protein
MQRLIEPTLTPEGRKAPGLKFGQPRVMALLIALCLFLTVPHPLRDKLDQVDAEIQRMLKEAHMDN